MNLRILKKLSKRAARMLPLFDDFRDQFPAEKWESYTGVQGHDHKHWERSRAKYPCGFKGEIQYRSKDGRDWIVMREPSHPLKGTIMVGAMSGYYEPEWEEETTWESLCAHVRDHFTEYSQDGWRLLRDLSTPTLIFRAAQEIIAEYRAAPRASF